MIEKQNFISCDNNLQFRIAQYTINLDLASDARVSSFLEATVRGGFGYTLRSLVCATKKDSCQGCLLRTNCVYAFIFETSPSGDSIRMKKYNTVPHPFTMRTIQDGSNLSIELSLFGDSHSLLPYFVYTLNKLGSKGLGKCRIAFEINNVISKGNILYEKGKVEIKSGDVSELITVYPGQPDYGTVNLTFLTPLTLRKNGHELEYFDTASFFSTLLRRITNLNAFYGIQKDMRIDPEEYLSEIDKLKTESSIRLFTRSRFSTRQKKMIQYGGLAGSVIFKGNVGPVIPILRAGELTGVGKNTAFGFGVYKIESVDISP